MSSIFYKIELFYLSSKNYKNRKDGTTPVLIRY
nr:MAG TPA: hypothetical protein [Caudoviricetes sp.]